MSKLQPRLCGITSAHNGHEFQMHVQRVVNPVRYHCPGVPVAPPEPDNHHNAWACAYCRPEIAADRRHAFNQGYQQGLLDSPILQHTKGSTSG